MTITAVAQLHNPDSSNLNATVSAATTAVNTAATTAAGGVATIAIGDAFAAISGYISAEQNTAQYRRNVWTAAQKFNQLVAAINSLIA